LLGAKGQLRLEEQSASRIADLMSYQPVVCGLAVAQGDYVVNTISGDHVTLSFDE